MSRYVHALFLFLSLFLSFVAREVHAQTPPDHEVVNVNFGRTDGPYLAIEAQVDPTAVTVGGVHYTALLQDSRVYMDYFAIIDVPIEGNPNRKLIIANGHSRVDGAIIELNAPDGYITTNLKGVQRTFKGGPTPISNESDVLIPTKVQLSFDEQFQARWYNTLPMGPGSIAVKKGEGGDYYTPMPEGFSPDPNPYLMIELFLTQKDKISEKQTEIDEKNLLLFEQDVTLAEQAETIGIQTVIIHGQWGSLDRKDNKIQGLRNTVKALKQNLEVKKATIASLLAVIARLRNLSPSQALDFVRDAEELIELSGLSL